MDAAGIAITATVTALVLSWVFREARRPVAAQPDGRFVLAYGRWMVGLGIVSGILVPIGIAAAVLHFGFREPNDPYYAAGLEAFFLVSGGWSLAEGLKRRVVVSDAGVVAHSPWGRTRRVDRPDVVTVGFAPMSGSLVLVSRSGETVKVSTMLKGITQLADAVRRHVPAPVAAKPLAQLAERLKHLSGS